MKTLTTKGAAYVVDDNGKLSPLNTIDRVDVLEHGNGNVAIYRYYKGSKRLFFYGEPGWAGETRIEFDHRKNGARVCVEWPPYTDTHQQCRRCGRDPHAPEGELKCSRCPVEMRSEEVVTTKFLVFPGDVADFEKLKELERQDRLEDYYEDEDLAEDIPSKLADTRIEDLLEYTVKERTIGGV